MTGPEARVLPGSQHQSGAEFSTNGSAETPCKEGGHLRSILSSSSFLCLLHGTSTGTPMLPKEGSQCVCVLGWGVVSEQKQRRER